MSFVSDYQWIHRVSKTCIIISCEIHEEYKAEPGRILVVANMSHCASFHTESKNAIIIISKDVFRLNVVIGNKV